MARIHVAHSRRVGRAFAVLIATFVTMSLLAPIGARSAQAGENTRDSIVTVTPQGRFSVYNSPTGDSSLPFGDPGDQPLMGDWDCDGVDTPGAYRTAIARAFVTNSTQGGGATTNLVLGNPGDTALVGDFNGDGCDTIAVFRSSIATFFIRNSLTSGSADRTFAFGNPGDQPFVGDFNGDGQDTFGVYRSNGWLFQRDDFGGSTPTITYPFGNPGDRIFTEDLDGDGTDVVAVYRPTQGSIYLARTGASMAVGKNRVVIAAKAGISARPETSLPKTPTSSPEPINYDIDVELWPGDDLGSIVSNAPEGTVFRINGVHTNQSIKPRDGQVFVGAPGAELRGEGAARAFSSSANNVRIEGLTVTGYQSKPQDGAIQAGGSGWVIRGNNVYRNAAVGIKVYKGDNATIDGNNVHHNGQLGISVAFSTGSIVENNEIAYNNWENEYVWGWEAGGTKFWSTTGLIVRNNWSNNNRGPGLWSDTDNISILYEGNLIEDNYANGIFHEIGYDAVIRNNIVRRNGFGHAEWLWGAGILIASSQNVEIYGNEVTGNYNGITMTQQDRGSGKYGPYIARNVNVYDNRIVNSGTSGAAQDIGSDAIFDANNTFTGNDYVGDVGWEWENRRVSWNSWLSFGLDAGSTYTP